MFSEYSAVIRRPKFERYISQARINEMLDLVAVGAHWVEPTERVTDCADPKDNAYLELASAAGAECIISGDPHLLTLTRWRGINNLTCAQFMTPGSEAARIEVAVEAYIKKFYADNTNFLLLDTYRDMARGRFSRWSPHSDISGEWNPYPGVG